MATVVLPALFVAVGGDDYSAQVASGSISSATGSFPYVSPGSTETGQQDGTGSQVANTFSLQLNTEFFSDSPACAGASTPSDCLAWQQFVYSSTYGGVFMQYWLIDYGTTCPAGWITYGSGSSTDCYQNSEGAFLAATAPTIATLESVSLTGTVDSGGNDSVVMEYGGNNVSAVGADSVLDVAGNWTVAEFAILGDGDGTEANFSSGTTLDVETAVDNGATASPSCDFDGFTAETNNLSFASAPTLSAGSEPAIETQQTSGGGTAGCAAAGQQTNTVTVTNPGSQTSTVGTHVSLQMKGTDSASGQTLTWSATGLPAGLSISSSSGLISGTPTTAGPSSVTVTAKDTTKASGSSSFTWTVTNTVTATTALSYTGPDQVATGSRFTATATLTSPAASCKSSQPVSFSLSADPLNGTSGTYSLGSATSTASGAISLPVSTTHWQTGAYMLTVSYTGTSNCAPSTTTASVAVTSHRQAAFGGGWYTVPGAGQTSFAFVVTQVRHSSGTYTGVLDVVTPGKWWFQANVTSYVKSSTTQGLLSGTGNLYWWNPALNKGRGGWQLAKSGVSYTATANATTETKTASFGINISYTPVPPQPTPLPNSAPIALTRGGITIT